MSVAGSSISTCIGRTLNSIGSSRRVSAVGKTNYDAFNCPICFELPPNRIFVCSAGHSVCEGCYLKMTNKVCPMCGAVFGQNPGRNYALEGILLVVDFSCKNEDFGCNWTGKRGEILNHEVSCDFKPIRCFIKDCTLSLPHHNYLQHIKSHSLTVSPLPLPPSAITSNLLMEFTVKYDLNLPPKYCCMPTYWTKGFTDTKFFFSAFIEDGRFYFGVSFLDKDQDRKYRFDAQFSNESKVIRNYPVWKVEGAFASSVYLQLDEEKRANKDVYFFNQPLQAFTQFKKEPSDIEVQFGINIKIHHCQFAKRSKTIPVKRSRKLCNYDDDDYANSSD